LRLSLALLALVALLAGGAFVAGGFSGGEARESEGPPAPPAAVTVTFDFLDTPNMVYLCWVHDGGDVNFFDVQTVLATAEGPHEEIRYGVKVSDCDGATGTSVYLWDAGPYHFGVRACNNAGCSDWKAAGDEERYWFEIPCSDPAGDACGRPR
jgi:hypothetical protein